MSSFAAKTPEFPATDCARVRSHRWDRRRDRAGLLAERGRDLVLTYRLALEEDERQFQRRLRVDIRDESGRTTTMTGEIYAEFAFPVSPDALLLDTMMAVDIAGRRGAVFLDFLWPPAYLDHITPVAANRSEA